MKINRKGKAPTIKAICDYCKCKWEFTVNEGSVSKGIISCSCPTCGKIAYYSMDVIK